MEKMAYVAAAVISIMLIGGLIALFTDPGEKRMTDYQLYGMDAEEYYKMKTDQSKPAKKPGNNERDTPQPSDPGAVGPVQQ